MKRLILIIVLALVLLAGCESVVPEEEVVIENPIDCNGSYFTSFRPFQMKDWCNCDFFAPRGMYWRNPDGRMFFLTENISEKVESDCCEDGCGFILADPIAMFGKCPSVFEWELVVPEPEVVE